MKMKNVLLLFMGLVVLAACEKKAPERPVNETILYRIDSLRSKLPKVPDSVVVQSGDVVSGLDLVRPKDTVIGYKAKFPGSLDGNRYRVYAIDSSSLPTRTLPDFTDASVGMLISTMGFEAPTQITSCIVTPLQNMISAIVGGDMWAPLLWPDPNLPSQSCSESNPERWYLTESQYCWVGRTDSVYLAAFVKALRAYEAELGRKGYWFPCRIVGLEYGSSLCLPVTAVQIQRIERDGRLVEFRIILLHSS